MVRIWEASTLITDGLGEDDALCISSEEEQINATQLDEEEGDEGRWSVEVGADGIMWENLGMFLGRILSDTINVYQYVNNSRI